jgi:NTP pyrophosphatase (non-canonical NTP hydrolase)
LIRGLFANYKKKNKMTPTEYSELSLRLANPEDRFTHAGIGIATEAGEIMDIVKRFRYYNKPIDRTHMIEELGDLAWYMNLMIDYLGGKWEEVFAMNVAKLQARYPEKYFTADRALNRNEEAEQTAMRC